MTSDWKVERTRALIQVSAQYTDTLTTANEVLRSMLANVEDPKEPGAWQQQIDGMMSTLASLTESHTSAVVAIERTFALLVQDEKAGGRG